MMRRWIWLGCVVGLAFGVPASAGGEHTFSVAYMLAQERDGGVPAHLVGDKAGNLYGTTVDAPNTICCGTIFKIAPDGTKTILYTFKGPPTDGGAPGVFVLDKDGTIYGTAEGGTRHYGMAYKLTPDGKETVLANFNAATGVYPYGSIM